MRKFFEESVKDKWIYSLIILNAVVLTIESFEGLGETTHSILYVIDYFCTTYFVYEMTVKISIFGSSNYFNSSWNRFDFSIVVLSSPMLLSPFMNVRGLGILLVLRVARLLRLMRLFHFIPNIESLWAGIGRALKASVGVFIAIFLYLFILTLFATHMFGDIAPTYFGDPFTSLYSMFQLLTVEGWYEIPNYIAENSSANIAIFAKVFFSFSVLTAGILGLSLANAVFVDEMVVDNTNQLEKDVKKLKSEIKELKSMVNSHFSD